MCPDKIFGLQKRTCLEKRGHVVALNKLNLGYCHNGHFEVWCLVSCHGLCRGQAANNHIFCVHLWNSEYEELQCHVSCINSLSKVLSVLQSGSTINNFCVTQILYVYIVGILLCHCATCLLHKSIAVLYELDHSWYHPITFLWFGGTVVYCVHVVGIFYCHMLCTTGHPSWDTDMGLSPITMLQEQWLHLLPVLH
jgi:hypothetical protein